MRLQINGKEVDYEGKIAISRQTYDANNLGIRLIDISNQIVLPKTERNKRIILGANRLESEALDVYYNAKVIDSYFIFSGVGILKNAGNSWKMQIIDGSKQFFESLKNDIKELDFESDDFVYGPSAYGTLKNLSTSPWVWPIVQMHESVSETNLQYLRPHFSFWSLLQKTFSSKGWTIEMDTDICENLAIQANSKDFKFTSFQKTLSGSAVGALTTNDFAFGVTLTAITIALGTNKTSFRIRGNVTSNGESKLKIGDDEIIFNDGTAFYDEETSELDGTVTVSLSGSVNFSDVLFYTIIKESSFDNLADFTPTGYRVKVYDNLPEISQKDLFKDALTLTLSVIVPDSQQKKITLKTLANLNALNKIDWSDKLINDSETINSGVDGLAEKNNLVYENSFGKAFFNTDLSFLDNETDYIKLRYAGSPDKEDFAVYNVYEVDSDSNNVRKSDEGLRIVYVSGDYGKFAPVGWKQLKANYYNNYVTLCLNKPRQIKALFNLKKLDVVGFDPMKLIYLEQYNAIFLVQAIEKFIPGELTEVKLLRYGR